MTQQIYLQRGWSCGEVLAPPSPYSGEEDCSIALHYQDGYNGQRTFVLGGSEDDKMLIGVEADNPSTLPPWKDLISIADFIKNGGTHGFIDPAYGLIYVKYLSNPSKNEQPYPDNGFVLMANPMSVGNVSATRLQTLDDKMKSGMSSNKKTRIILLPIIWLLWIVISLFTITRHEATREDRTRRLWLIAILFLGCLILTMVILAKTKN